MRSIAPAEVLGFRARAQQLDRATGAVDDTAVLDIGVLDPGPDGGRWALAIRGIDPTRMADGRSCRSDTGSPPGLRHHGRVGKVGHLPAREAVQLATRPRRSAPVISRRRSCCSSPPAVARPRPTSASLRTPSPSGAARTSSGRPTTRSTVAGAWPCSCATRCACSPPSSSNGRPRWSARPSWRGAPIRPRGATSRSASGCGSGRT